MMRILFVVVPERGHINPYIGPAQVLQQRGHAVGFFALADISEQLARAGLEQICASREAPEDDNRANRGRHFAERVRDAAWLREWIRTLLIDRALDVSPLLEEACDAFAPDLLVTDPMVYAAAIVAHRRGLRWAAVSNSLNPVLPDAIDSELLRTVRGFAAERDRLFSSTGMELSFRGCDMLSPYLTVAFTTEALLGRATEGVQLVGPSLPRGLRGDETPWPDGGVENGDDPLIYMSLGSQIYFQPRMFRVVLEAVEDRPVRLLLSAGDLLESGELGALPENVVSAAYLPQLSVLEHARVMISHGGANSVMEAIRAGVPMLISPICNDQFHQAWFLERAGIGIVTELELATADEVWTALESLMGEGRHRRALAHVTASYRVDGAGRCAELIELMA